ncbi:MAG: outer-membrane lipoprotein carrier protein LolA [Ignavibacteria bacterium]|nr:outer-membrane lipoprotein carrier protein LolA [Ignavibacteria bacterium]
MRTKLIVFLLTVVSVFAQNDKTQVYNSLLTKYGNITSISLKFKSLNNHSLEGKLDAQKGNKYVLRMGDRVITCNGKTLWNYSETDKNVIISNFDSNIHTNSLENFFFSLISQLNPVELKVESSSRGTSFKILTLEPKTSEQFSQIKLWIDTKGEIASISIIKDKNEEKWAIWDVRINPKFEKEYFNFKAPKNVETIDIR